MSDTFEPFLLSLPPMLRREPAFDREVNEPRILVLVKIVMRARQWIGMPVFVLTCQDIAHETVGLKFQFGPTWRER